MTIALTKGEIPVNSISPGYVAMVITNDKKGSSYFEEGDPFDNTNGKGRKIRRDYLGPIILGHG